MTIHCKAPSRFRFTPGRTYTANPGGLTPADYYLDVLDDAGALQRFALKPRRQVRNEHPITDLEPAFPVPAPAAPTEAEHVLAEITRGVFQRPLILSPRFGHGNAKQWVSDLRQRTNTEVHQLVRPSDYNSLLAAGLPEGIYVSHLLDLFLTRNGQPSPSIIGCFDFLYVSKQGN